MSEPKTKPNKASVEEFVKEAAGDRIDDCKKIMSIMEKATGEKPIMWGGSIVGYGTYHYVYASGKEGDWPLTGFSPRKQNLTLYIMTGFEKETELMGKLGKFKTGKSCLYIKRLSDIDEAVLEEIVDRSVKKMKKKFG